MSKLKEAKETINHFFNQFDYKDERTALVLELLFESIFNQNKEMHEPKQESQIVSVPGEERQKRN